MSLAQGIVHWAPPVAASEADRLLWAFVALGPSSGAFHLSEVCLVPV